MFQWTAELIRGVRRSILSNQVARYNVFVANADYELAPGAYTLLVSDAECAIAFDQKGQNILRDDSSIPTQGIYLEPGRSFRFDVDESRWLRIEPESGSIVTLIARVLW